jgi:hypothetical protein
VHFGISLDSSPNFPFLSTRIQEFANSLLVPIYNTSRAVLSRTVIKVVTLGPEVTTSSVHSQLNSLFPSIEIIVIVTRQNVYDLPVVAVSQTGLSFSAFESLRRCEHVFGLADQHVIPVYVFWDHRKSSVQIDKNMSVVFSSEPNADPLVMNAL